MGICAFRAAHKEGGDNGGENAAGGDDEGEDNAIAAGDSDCAEGHCGDDGADIALKEVCAHTGNVADVVADVIGDNSGVAGVVLGDAGLDLTDEVSADVGSLGVDTAADTRKQRDGGSTEGEAEQNVELTDDNIQDRCAQKAEAHDAHTHDRAAGEGNGQCLVHTARAGRVRGADVCLGGDIHADIAGENGEYGTAEEAYRGDPAVLTEKQADSQEQYDDKDSKDLVLRKKESLCAFIDGGGDLLHAVRTCVLL